MTHVGVQGLGASNAQHHRTEHDEGERFVFHDQSECIGRRNGQQHERMPHNLARAEHTDDDEPHRHDRTEDASHAVSAAVLHGEQHHDDRQADRQHELLKSGRGYFQSLDRRQDRDGRRDDAVAEEQAGTRNADESEEAAHSGADRDALRQRHQRQDATLAAVVGAHDQGDVFNRDDQDERPEDQRQDPEDFNDIDRYALEKLQAGLQGVERAGADVAIHHAEHGEQDAGAGQRFAFRAGGGGGTAHHSRGRWGLVIGRDLPRSCLKCVRQPDAGPRTHTLPALARQARGRLGEGRQSQGLCPDGSMAERSPWFPSLDCPAARAMTG